MQAKTLMHAGAVIENVIIDPDTRAVDYDDISVTENTRCAYPLEVAAEPSSIP